MKPPSAFVASPPHPATTTAHLVFAKTAPFLIALNIKLTRGGSAHVVLRAGRRCQPIYEAICQTIRQSAWVVPDETGWRVGGLLAWLHGFVADNATAYVIDPTRSHEPAERLLGLDYHGVMVHDGWSPYDRFVMGLRPLRG